MTFDPHSSVVRAQGRATAEIDEELVILNLPRDNYIALNDVGRRVWDLLERPRRVEELCRLLGDEFDGPIDKIRADVLAFLDELHAEDLVRVAE